MPLVHEPLLTGYLLALTEALDGAALALPPGRLRTALVRIRRRLGKERSLARLERLRRLTALAEAQGLLDPGQVIVIRRLVYRVSWLAARRQGMVGSAGIGGE